MISWALEEKDLQVERLLLKLYQWIHASIPQR